MKTWRHPLGVPALAVRAEQRGDAGAQLELVPVGSGAAFSACGRYRYTLWRPFSDGVRLLLWIMLNPSIADAMQNDPTIRRCIGFARAWGGYDGMLVVNLFAWIATNPRELEQAADAIGNPRNDAEILSAARRSVTIVCAWGKHGELRDRGAEVARMLRAHGHPLYCLGRNGDGSPKHPLYLRSDTRPQPFER